MKNERRNFVRKKPSDFSDDKTYTIMRMEKFTITLHEDGVLEKYLGDSFAALGCETEIKKTGTNTVLETETSKEAFRDVVSEAIVLFCKYRVLIKAFPKRRRGALFGAFCGVLLAQDYDKEKETVKNKLPEANDVNFDGIFTFLLAELDYGWRALGTLANKLYEQCNDDEDVLALIKYFLGGEVLLSRTLVVDNGIYFDDNNEDLVCAEMTDDENENVALNLLLRKPTEIIVPMPGRYSPEFITIIKRLGE